MFVCRSLSGRRGENWLGQTAARVASCTGPAQDKRISSEQSEKHTESSANSHNEAIMAALWQLQMRLAVKWQKGCKVAAWEAKYLLPLPRVKKSSLLRDNRKTPEPAGICRQCRRNERHGNDKNGGCEGEGKRAMMMHW